MRLNFNTNISNKDEWLTPPELINSLGQFDLDPCSPIGRPWDTAKKHYSIVDDGLTQKWGGRIWLNPPYGKETFKWVDKLASHGNGIALIFARTETKGFHRSVFEKADAIFFLEGRLRFWQRQPNNLFARSKHNANAPSCLVIYGDNNIDVVLKSGIKGHLCLINK